MLKKLLPAQIRAAVKNRSKYKPYFAAVNERSASLEAIANRLRTSYQPLRCPLILISQVERSGGSLMAQLLDGHPEVLSHPHELKIGYPNKHVWPPLNVSDADEQFRLLFELSHIEFLESGYAKGKHDTYKKNFFLVPYIQREVFKTTIEKAQRTTARDVLNAYFTSYFNAWLNMRTRMDQARFISGFVPMMAADKHNMDEFWSAYPDGFLISIIRSPLTWHPSFARLKSKKGPLTGNVDATAARWKQSTEAMFRERDRKGDRVIILSFDDLVSKTEATMRGLSCRLGIEFQSSLVSPTFNSEPMASNSIFEATQPGLVTNKPAKRACLLSEAEREYLELHCMELYRRALHDIVERVA